MLFIIMTYIKFMKTDTKFQLIQFQKISKPQNHIEEIFHQVENIWYSTPMLFANQVIFFKRYKNKLSKQNGRYL